MDINSKILILGKKSPVAKEIAHLLVEKGYVNVYSAGREDADLTDKESVEKLFYAYRPCVVFCVAARAVTPQESETCPWDTFRDNLLMSGNVLDTCLGCGCEKLIWFSSTAALPYYGDFREVTEEELLDAPVKRSIEPYALAKLAGIQMCKAMEGNQSLSAVAVLPCDIYGAGQKGLMYNLCKDFMDAKEYGQSEVRVLGGG